MLETFPSYDFPLTGNVPESTESGSADLPFGYDYNDPAINGNTQDTKFKTTNIIPPKPFTLGTVVTDFSGGVGTVLAAPINLVKGAIGSVTSTVRNTYLYLIGGVALIGIIAIVGLGAASRFSGRIGGN